MASDIESYLQARFDYEEIKQIIDKIADDLVLIGNALKRDPARFSFADTGIDLPKDAFVGQSYPSTDWPNPTDIQVHLKRLHEARITLRTTWAFIPQKLRAGLQPPPSGVLPPQRYDRKAD